MTIREADSSDTKGIISVLKASLGESKLKKSEKIWNYKHIENPFGRSLVLVAEADNEIIGVRAFMRWEWQLNDEVFNAYRAVDTATHPAHQGKGIFKKLTSKALDLAKEQGCNLIFNTPNNKSLPGYLKMGWQKADRLKVQVLPGNPLTFLRRHTGIKDNDQKKIPKIIMERTIEEFNYVQKHKDKFFTPKTFDYLKWRYEENPLQNYHILAGEDFFLAAYVKDHNYFKELRIAEHIFSPDISIKKIRKTLSRFLEESGAHIITSTEILELPLSLAGKFGPILTIKDVNLNSQQYAEFLEISNWSYSLGDLELF